MEVVDIAAALEDTTIAAETLSAAAAIEMILRAIDRALENMGGPTIRTIQIKAGGPIEATMIVPLIMAIAEIAIVIARIVRTIATAVVEVVDGEADEEEAVEAALLALLYRLQSPDRRIFFLQVSPQISSSTDMVLTPPMRKESKLPPSDPASTCSGAVSSISLMASSPPRPS